MKVNGYQRINAEISALIISNNKKPRKYAYCFFFLYCTYNIKVRIIGGNGKPSLTTCEDFGLVSNSFKKATASYTGIEISAKNSLTEQLYFDIMIYHENKKGAKAVCGFISIKYTAIKP